MHIYIWGGSNDRLFGVAQPKKTANWYKQYSSNVVEEYTDCGHSYPNALPATAQNPKQSCQEPKMTNSGDDTAGKTLAHVMQE